MYQIFVLALVRKITSRIVFFSNTGVYFARGGEGRDFVCSPYARTRVPPPTNDDGRLTNSYCQCARQNVSRNHLRGEREYVICSLRFHSNCCFYHYFIVPWNFKYSLIVFYRANGRVLLCALGPQSILNC